MSAKTIASPESVKAIFEEVAPSGSMDAASFANIMSGKRDFPDTKEEVLDAFSKVCTLVCPVAGSKRNTRRSACGIPLDMNGAGW